MTDFLRRMTVHRLMLYYLSGLFIAAEVFCAGGILPSSKRALFGNRRSVDEVTAHRVSPVPPDPSNCR